MSIRQSFSTRLSVFTVSASIGVYLMIIIIIGVLSNDIIFKESKKTIIDNLQTCSLEIERNLVEVESAAHGLIWLTKQNIGNTDALFDLTSNLVQVNPLIVGSGVVFVPGKLIGEDERSMPYSFFNENKKLVRKNLGETDYDYTKMEWYNVPLQTRQNYWSNAYMDEGGGNILMITYSMPLWDENNEVYAIFSVDISLESFTKNIGNIRLMNGAYPLLCSQNGTYLYHPDSTKIFNYNVKDFIENVGESLKAYEELGEQDGIREARFMGLDGVPYFMAYEPLDNGWSAGIVCPYLAAFTQTEHLRRLFWIMTLLGIALMFYSNKKIIDRTTMPLTEYTFSALNMAQGNFHAQIPPVSTKDEIGRLHDSLKYLQLSIVSYIKELRATTASNERFESELNIATGIQEQMLTHTFPNNDKVNVWAHVHPAKEVGGDLYDIFIKDNYLYFSVGDVSGKGVPAALYMAITRSALRFMFQLNIKMEEVVSNINNAFCDGNESGMFVTMFVGKINLNTYEMEYCNAGHNPIVIKKADGSASYLHAKPNIAAGLFSDFPYQGESLTLEKGSSLLVYSDGVTEAETFDKDQYGEQRLLDFVASNSSDGKDFVDALRKSIRDFAGNNEQNDDITILSVHLK